MLSAKCAPRESRKNTRENPTLLIRATEAQKMSKLAASNRDCFTKTAGSHLSQLNQHVFLLMHGWWSWFAWSMQLGAQVRARHAAAGQLYVPPFHSPFLQYPPQSAWGSFCLGFGSCWWACAGYFTGTGVFISVVTRGKFECRFPEVLKQYRQSLMGQSPSSINLTIPIYLV